MALTRIGRSSRVRGRSSLPPKAQVLQGHRLGSDRMKLRDFFALSSVKLTLASSSKDEVLGELIRLLGLDEKSAANLYKTLKRRENLGSTGIGHGIAIPHCRSLVVNTLRLAYGRKRDGMAFDSVDGEPVHHFFLIVAPPPEVSNQYLPVLGKIAQFAKDPAIPKRLSHLTEPAEFLKLLEERAS
ncbi:MAG: PTS sugar transporter subunit IIA [Gemmatimonadetes bacterium]|nr:PTS sugar transporter subunit IIA [Gemmatimonadota bacterium]